MIAMTKPNKATIADGQNLVNFDIEVDWQDLLDWDSEALDDYAENEFNKNRDDTAILSDLGYELIGREGDTLTFQVSALVEPMW